MLLPFSMNSARASITSQPLHVAEPTTSQILLPCVRGVTPERVHGTEDYLAAARPWKVRSKHGEPLSWDGPSSVSRTGSRKPECPLTDRTTLAKSNRATFCGIGTGQAAQAVKTEGLRWLVPAPSGLGHCGIDSLLGCPRPLTFRPAPARLAVNRRSSIGEVNQPNGNWISLNR